jgi:hypothetical protein
MNIYKREVEIMFSLVHKKSNKEIEYQTVIDYRRTLIDVIGYDYNFVDFIEELCSNAWYLNKSIEHVIAAIESFGYEVWGVK